MLKIFSLNCFFFFFMLPSFELELEIIHNKKNYYKTIDGKEARKAYIYTCKIKF